MFVEHGILYKPSLGRVSICRGKKLSLGYKVIQKTSLAAWSVAECSHLLSYHYVWRLKSIAVINFV